MAYEHKPGDGTLYAEREKRSERAPDWSGFVLAHRDIKAGERVRLAGWQKTDTLVSLKLSDERTQQGAAPAKPGPTAADYRAKRTAAPSSHASGASSALDDDIPFAPEWRV